MMNTPLHRRRAAPGRHALAAGLTTLAAAVAAALVIAAAITPGRPPVAAAPDQTGQSYFLPNVQSSGFRSLAGLLDAEGLTGMSGFGDTTIELQNLAAQAATVDINLANLEATRNLKRQVAARGSATIVLKSESAVALGSHSARIASNAPLGVIARTTWAGGAEVAYEAPEAARELILPLMARNVLSHTTSFYIHNTSGSDEVNQVKLNIFDDTNGELLKDIIVDLDPFGVADYDPYVDPPRFGDLPANASGGGFVGAIRFSADAPVAVLAYGDELDLDSRGSAAYVARPVAAASNHQYLPLVRANYFGDSWIGIASRETTPISVKVTYRGAADSPAGAGQVFEQSFEIGRRGAAFVDLSGRGRGTRPAPGLPRGAATNRGFYGSAVIEANGRVLAAVVQSTYPNAAVITSTTSAAYNAFGAADLGTRFALAKVRYGAAAGATKTELAVMNPGTDAANVSIAYNDPGQPVAGPSAAIPAGAMRIIALEAKGADKPATITSDVPVAVLVNDTATTSSNWLMPSHDTSIYWPVRLSGAVTPSPTPTGGATTAAPPSPTPTATATATAQVSTATATATSPTLTPTPVTPTVAPTTAGTRLKVFLPVGYRNEKVR